jgi:hypothetical protein
MKVMNKHQLGDDIRFKKASKTNADPGDELRQSI